MATIVLAKLIDHEKNMEIYKWKWMVLGALGYMNNTYLKKVNNKIVLDVFIICQKLRHIQVILKNTVLVRTHRPSKYSPKASTVRCRHYVLV